MKAGVYGPTVERLALAAKVRALRAAGLTHQAVADRLGISRSYASSLADDPDGSLARKRKDSYAGECMDCRGVTSGSDGRDRAPKRCESCRKEYEKSTRFWTRERTIDAARRWAEVHGRPPAAADWRPADPTFPYPNGSQCYGWGDIGTRENWETWNDFLRAAGLPTWSMGQHGRAERTAA